LSTTPRAVSTGHAGSTAAFIDITVSGSASAGSVLVDVGGAATTVVSFNRGEARSNSFIARLTGTGKFRVRSTTPVQVTIDTTGAFSGAASATSSHGLFVVESRTRIVDTLHHLQGTTRIAAGSTHQYVVGGSSGVPLTARNVLVSIATASPSTAGSLLTMPSLTAAPPVARALTVPSGGVSVSNLAVAQLSSAKATIRTTTTTHLLVHVTGWFTP
jgi:hypothetical protein